MKKLFQWIGGICELLNAWPVLLPFLGPPVWMYWLATERQYLKLSTVAVLWLLSTAFVINEIRRGKLTPVSLGLFLAWMVVMAYVFINHYA